MRRIDGVVVTLYPGYPLTEPEISQPSQNGQLKDVQWGPTYNTYTTPSGFPRHGPYCYRNTAILLLLHAPAFVHWLSQHTAGCVGNPLCLPCAIAHLAADYWVADPMAPAYDGDLHKQMESAWTIITVECWSGKVTHGCPNPKAGPQDTVEFLEALIRGIQASLRRNGNLQYVPRTWVDRPGRA
jgi:hypothetical protein